MVLFTKLSVALRSNFRFLEGMIVVLLHMIKICVILCCQEGSLLVLCKIFYELWPTCLDRQPARRTLFCNSWKTSLPQASSLVEHHAFTVITAWRTFFFLSHPVSYLCGTSWAFFSRGKPLLLWRGVEVALILWFWDKMMIVIVVYAVTEVCIKTAVLTSTQRLATQNTGPFRWGLHMCLVWISKPVISFIEEETLSLSVFTIVFVLFLLLSYFWPIIVLFVTISACLMSLFHSYVAGWNYALTGPQNTTVNPLRPNIHIQILQTDLYIFP